MCSAILDEYVFQRCDSDFLNATWLVPRSLNAGGVMWLARYDNGLMYLTVCRDCHYQLLLEKLTTDTTVNDQISQIAGL